MSGLFGGGDSAEINVPERDLAKEARTTLNVKRDLTPQELELERRYRPEYTGLEVDSQRQALGGLSDVYREIFPGLVDANVAAGQQGAEGAIGVARNIAPDYRASENELNPFIEPMQRQQDELAIGAPGGSEYVPRLDEIIQRNTGASRIQDRLEQDAYGRIGDGLNEQENRDLTQNVREAYNDRGLLRSNPAMLDEARRLTQANEGRRLRNNRYAQEVERHGLDTAGRQTDLTRQGVQVGRQLDDDRFRRLGGAVQSRMQRYLSPYDSTNNAGVGISAGQALSQGQAVAGRGGAGKFGFFDPYAQDLYSSNQNAAASQSAANAQASAGRSSGLFGAIGDIGGSLVGGLF